MEADSTRRPPNISEFVEDDTSAVENSNTNVGVQARRRIIFTTEEEGGQGQGNGGVDAHDGPCGLCEGAPCAGAKVGASPEAISTTADTEMHRQRQQPDTPSTSHTSEGCSEGAYAVKGDSGVRASPCVGGNESNESKGEELTPPHAGGGQAPEEKGVAPHRRRSSLESQISTAPTSRQSSWNRLLCSPKSGLVGSPQRPDEAQKSEAEEKKLTKKAATLINISTLEFGRVESSSTAPTRSPTAVEVFTRSASTPSNKKGVVLAGVRNFGIASRSLQTHSVRNPYDETESFDDYNDADIPDDEVLSQAQKLKEVFQAAEVFQKRVLEQAKSNPQANTEELQTQIRYAQDVMDDAMWRWGKAEKRLVSKKRMRLRREKENATREMMKRRNSFSGHLTTMLELVQPIAQSAVQAVPEVFTLFYGFLVQIFAGFVVRCESFVGSARRRANFGRDPTLAQKNL